MVDLIQVLGLAAIGSIAGLIGGVVFLVKKNWAQTLSKVAVPFAAGVLLSVSLLHLLPEATHEMGDNAFVIVMAAFLGSFVFEHFVAHLHHHSERGRTSLKSAAPLVIFGDTVHNFIDGVAIASAFLVEPTFGLIVALATFLHETPHEIGDFGILVSAGWSRVRAFWTNFFSALATFPGALVTLFLIGERGEAAVAPLLAISAGIFLYLGASDFLPEIHDHDTSHKIEWQSLVFLFLGVVVMYGLKFVVPEH
ncbi:hypothetical protein A2630_03855 [Candidatus Woesebacteria bacterium RIFCSPHIGHO2_01_FULL_44_10]|uniref:ZIP zinc transporter n=1 Tax=Candidatus Woesebacteria bacterium RIFCSPLOWO2_01_FULL_44_14 TaxID=1802525 RepID=A0A1F8C5D6_9BACT|nr:MAG: hypothetical protein A2630_03855 [Candidatus Woesebacteria bacterium RIFCSPHIGHO2_01_FULL_44_10]OGM55612.1 MAG: hypothetical protein A3F62_02265 [Candidatus Woesebacteria bacterium RIFCSPHIGHO2_12_FULL_44_11]OGM70885.1 MAG: hypothetical protein A2975_01255 [Candidatus Woesebacteria bacterium RIFCSPLOWO2_01_FULL_44_14]